MLRSIRFFLVLPVITIALSTPSQAQNLNQKYRGSWNCNRLSTDGADSISLYNACRKCELAGQEFVKTSSSTGRCEGRSPSSSKSDGSKQDIAKGRLEEKDGDADFRNNDWLGASSSYETSLKYFEAAGSQRDVARVEKKRNAADCEYSQKMAREKEKSGDLRKALGNLLNALPQCKSAESDVSLIEGEIVRLRGKLEQPTDKAAAPARQGERTPKVVGASPVEWSESMRNETKLDGECPNYSFYFDDLPYLAICEYYTIGSIENKVAVNPSDIAENIGNFWRTGKKATWRGVGCDAGFSKENAEGSAKIAASTYATADAKRSVAYFGRGKFRFDAETEYYTCRILREPCFGFSEQTCGRSQ